MTLCLLGLGSNLGDRSRLLDEALARLQRHPNISVTRRSRSCETPPAGGPAEQGPYLNAAAVVDTSLAPQALLEELQAIEAALGRKRHERWGPRPIDLDLLLYGDLAIAGPQLIVPHPRMAWRRFVLEPAAEIAPEMLHPGLGRTIARLLEHLNRTPWYVAIAGPMGVGKTFLAGEIAEKTGARLLADPADLDRLKAFSPNPSGLGRQVELEFLDRRAAELAIGQPLAEREDRPTVSDFWFGQSPAFARAWLDEEHVPAYLARWRELRPRVLQPRLIVLLRAPLEALLARLRASGRVDRRLLTIEHLRRLEQALDDLAAEAEGPVLRLDASDKDAAVSESVAAVEAMR